MAAGHGVAVTVPQHLNGLSIGQRRLLNHALIFFGLVALWELGARTGKLDPLFFPSPTSILQSFWLLYIANGNIWPELYATLSLVLMGWLMGSVLGVGLGALVGFNAVLRRFLQPYVIVLEATPRIAVAPLLIAGLGFGVLSKVAIIMLVCFFAPFINTFSGVINIDREKLELFHSLRASKMQVLRKLVVPDALVAEFIQRDSGIGSLILIYTRNLNMASSFACIFTLTAVGFLIFKGMEMLDAHIAFWKHETGMRRIGNRKRREMTYPTEGI